MHAVNYQNSGTSAQTQVANGHMRAVVFDHYGPLDNLTLGIVAKPTIGDHEVRVRVHAAALHVGDCFAVRGEPLLMRVETGIFRPKRGIPGFDLAGTVDAVGPHVTRFRPGDAVFGASMGTCAQFVVANENLVAHKPSNLSFEQAAALPTSGLAALHALRDVANVQPGQKVLINGASGGVGHFAVQIAKSLGAEVTGVCSTRNLDMVRALGADHVIDYTQEDFTAGGPRFDVIFDNVENRPLAACRRALTQDGTLILNSGTGASGLAMLIRLLKPLVVSPFVRHNLRRYLSTPNHDDLQALAKLAESEQLEPTIDSVHGLTDTPAALRHIASGRASGKVVIRVHAP